MSIKNIIIMIIASIMAIYGEENKENNKPKIETSWACVNGYLSIAMYYPYYYGDLLKNPFEGFYRNMGAYKTYCATYDLYTGKKLKYSDLFFDGEDYSSDLYGYIQSDIPSHNLGQYIKRELYTLPQDYENFTINQIIFDKYNKYFSEGIIFGCGHVVTMTPTITVARDMKEIFTEDIKIEHNYLWVFENEINKTRLKGYQYKIPKIKHWDKNVEEKINNNLPKYMEYLIENSYIFPSTEGEAYYRYERNTVSVCTDYKEDENSIRFDIYTGYSYPMFMIQLNSTTGKIENINYASASFLIEDRSYNITDEIYEKYSKKVEEMGDNTMPNENYEERDRLMEQLMIQDGLLKDTKKALEDLKKLD